jgi:hypothetical protein
LTSIGQRKPEFLKHCSAYKRALAATELRRTMKTTAIIHTPLAFLFWSAISRAARLSFFGFVGGVLFLPSENVACKAVLLGEVLGLAVLVAITWYPSRARADRRWRIALDHYAEKELERYAEHGQTKRTHPGGRLT